MIKFQKNLIMMNKLIVNLKMNNLLYLEEDVKIK